MKTWIIGNRRAIIFVAAALLHLSAFIFIRFALPPPEQIVASEYTILKLVDVEEYIPPPPPPPEVVTTVVFNQSASSETVIETENPVLEVMEPITAVAEPEYLMQHKISHIPEIPTAEILARIEYPPIALRQGIEGVVYLELYIDQAGAIRKINVLKDPGYGFAEAAVAAIGDMLCRPALANGVPVAVRFRYPVRFTLH